MEPYLKIFTRHKWQWFATLTFNHRPDYQVAEKAARVWLRELCKRLHMQIAALGAFNGHPSQHPHFHLLMLGKNRKGQSLLDFNGLCGMAGKLWGRNALVEPVKDHQAVAAYTTKNLNLSQPDLSDIFIYNRRLILQQQR